MNPHRQRAMMLIEQNRFDMAEKELRQSLLQYPNDAETHSLLAICLSQLGQHDQAEHAAAEAIELAPDSSHAFYSASAVSFERGSIAKAKSEIETAIQIDPFVTNYFMQLAAVQVQQKDWQDALGSAERGLELNPEHIGCTNVRALCLTKLGRKAEAGSAMRSALERAPEDAWSHANLGWSLLGERQPKEAMPHFREALRLEPGMEWARLGIVEAMKGHFFIYRIFLGFLIWMSKLKGQYLWGIVIGGWLGYQVCISLLRNNPNLKPILLPLIILYIAFVVMTWISSALFNLVLRCNKFGRMALSQEETRTSTWVGCALLTVLAFVGCWWWTQNENFLEAALAAGFTIPVLATFYSSDEGWPREAHRVLVAALVGLGLFVLVGAIGSLVFAEPLSEVFSAMAVLVGLPMLILAIAGQFAVNFLVMAKPRRGTTAGQTTRIVGMGILGLLFLGIMGFFSFLIGFTALFPDALEEHNFEQMKFADPIEINLVQEQSIEWENAAALEETSLEYEKLGFTIVGDYSVEEQPGVNYRYWLSADATIVAETSENIEIPSRVANVLFVKEERGQPVLEADSSYLAVGAFPRSWKVNFGVRSIEKLLEAIREESAGLDLRKFKPEEISLFAEKQWAISQAHLLRRGGYRIEEIIGLAEAVGGKVSEANAERIADVWKVQAVDLLRTLQNDEYKEKHPEFANKDLYFYDQYGDISDLYRVIGAHGLVQYTSFLGEEKSVGLDERPSKMERLSRVVDTLGENSPIEKIGTIGKPIPADVYLIRQK